MSGKKNKATCPRCGWEGDLAIINLATGEIFCKECSHPLPLVPPPIPWLPARVGVTSVINLIGRVRSPKLKHILIDLGAHGYKLLDYELADTISGDSSSRALRRYNATLRKLNAGFRLVYLPKLGVIVRVDTADDH